MEEKRVVQLETLTLNAKRRGYCITVKEWLACPNRGFWAADLVRVKEQLQMPV